MPTWTWVLLGMWIIWMFRGVFPIWILLLGLAFLIGRPVLDWLEWRIRTHERDGQEEEQRSVSAGTRRR